MSVCLFRTCMTRSSLRTQDFCFWFSCISFGILSLLSEQRSHSSIVSTSVISQLNVGIPPNSSLWNIPDQTDNWYALCIKF